MTDRVREEFEAAYRAAQIKLGVKSPDRLFVRGLDGEYLSVAESHAWWGWQASRAAMSVQMPDAHSYTVPDVAGAAILDCMTAIQKAGGKAKL